MIKTKKEYKINAQKNNFYIIINLKKRIFMETKQKTIGLIGGMSWESTVTYYQIINETIKQKLGGLHSAKILLYSVNFAEIEHLQSIGAWHKSAEILANIAQCLEKAGADFIVICTNTMHKVVPFIKQKISIPLLHIAEATAEALKEQNIHKIGLLGTQYTLTQNFYKDILTEKGIEVVIPNKVDIFYTNNIIYEELCRGIILPSSKEIYLNVIAKLQQNGVEAIVLGCTEIGLLIKQEDVSLPIFDTTLIHARKAAILSIEK